MFRICEECCLPNTSMATECVQCQKPLTHLPKRDGASLNGAIIEKRYRMMDFVGEGAMAWVYRGVHTELGSSVAVKILKPTFAQDPRFLARFKKEATAIGALSHPNILSVITSGDTPSGFPYMVCEFIKGSSLAAIISREGRLPLPRALHIFSQILSALDEAHSRGIVHRDLKPDNIMVMSLRSGEDFCKIVDFGIAFQPVANEQRLTQHGELFGTPEYMAPETIKGQPATAVSDLYAAGIILYEMLSGQVPFCGPAIFDTLLAHIEKPHPRLTGLVPELPQEIDAVMDRVLAKNPAQRVQSAIEFQEMLKFSTAPAVSACSSCGQEMLSSHKFCPNCGATNQQLIQSGRVDPKSVVETMERIRASEKKLHVPFFGRDRERTAVRDFLSSRRLCMEITGDDGIGKTALLDAVLSGIENSSITVAACGSDPLGCQRSWQPVRELARKVMGLPEFPTLSDILGACMMLEMDPQDVPHILFLFNLENDQPQLEFTVRLREMITSVARFILAAAADRPTLLVMEDVDGFDIPSCQVAEQLYFMIQGRPVKMILTGKTPLFNPQAMPEALYAHLPLAPLEQEVVRDLAFVTLSENGGSWHGGIDALADACRGIPLYAAEGMRLLAEGEDIAGLPAGDMVQLRIRRLPKKAQQLLQWIAVWGMDAPFELAVMALGSAEEARRALEVCEKRGFVSILPDDSIRLAHRLFLRVVLEEMPSTLRAEIHSAILDSDLASELDVRSLAFHTLYARRMEQTLTLMERAAATCESHLDDHGAVFYYRHAHELTRMEALSGKNEARFARISARYGDLLRYTGRLDAAVDVLKDALACCADSPACEAVLLSSLARCLAAQSASGPAEEVINRAARAAQKTRDPQVMYRVYHDLGQIELQKGRYDVGITQLRMALAMMEGHPRQPVSAWRLYLQCAQFEYMQGHPQKALETCLDTLEKLAGRSLLAHGRLHEFAARMYLHMKRTDEALQHFQLAAEYLGQTGDRISQVENILALGSLDADSRLEWAENARLIASRIGFFKGMEEAGQLLSM